MSTCVCSATAARRHHRAGASLLVAVFFLSALAILPARPAAAAIDVGEQAPAFALTDAGGGERSLADYAGKTVVLEWTNHECPYVRKHYDSGNMQALQKQAADSGVVWLTIISSAPGEQGYVSGDKAEAIAAEAEAAPSAILLDPEGRVGQAYGAKTTPHMYVIDGKGRLVYMGGIDDRPTTRRSDIEGARNHVALALADLSAGRPVSEASTRPYGCSIKYRTP